MNYNIVVLFLLIFSFPIPGLGNSFQLAICIALLSLFYHHRLFLLYRNICSKYIFVLIISTVFLIVYAFFLPILLGTHDFSRVQALLSLLIGVVSVVIVYSSLTIDFTNADSVGKLLSSVFLIQTFISLAAFVSPNIRQLIAFFQFQNDMEIAQESYAGIRALSISGRLYFEFAAVCGLMVIIQMKRMLDKGYFSYNMLLGYLLLIICGFFAGRTSLSGIVFSLMLLVCYKRSFFSKCKFFMKLLVCSLFFMSIILVILPNTLLDFINVTLLPWVFDLFIKFHETGSTESSYSFNMLNEMYNTVQITLQEWIIGAGRYVNEDGSYYKSVDAGYLRQLLFWGIIGSIWNLIYSIQFFRFPWKSNKERNERFFLIIIFLYTSLLHYKGELMGISRFYYVVLLMYLLHMFLCKYRRQSCIANTLND